MVFLYMPNRYIYTIHCVCVCEDGSGGVYLYLQAIVWLSAFLCVFRSFSEDRFGYVIYACGVLNACI